jgi:hypothetical protein
VNAEMTGGRLLRDMDWCNDRRCLVCRKLYENFNAGISFRDGAQAVRQANGGDVAGGGFRSRGPVLWAMRCLKLDAWAEMHLDCGFSWKCMSTEEKDEARAVMDEDVPF